MVKNIKFKKKQYIYQDIKNILLHYYFEKILVINNKYCSCEMCDETLLFY